MVFKMKTIPVSDNIHRLLKQHMAKARTKHKTMQSFVDAAILRALKRR
jgi:hypothetical protein